MTINEELMAILMCVMKVIILWLMCNDVILNDNNVYININSNENEIYY